MSPQEEIFTEIAAALEGSTELTTLLGGTPNVFANYADPNTRPPYIVYKMSKIDNACQGIVGDGKLQVSIWFYTSNSANAYTAEDIIVRLFDQQTLNTSTIKNCRMWNLGEERKESIKKDYIKDRDAINIVDIFYLRWIGVSRIIALGGS